MSMQYIRDIYGVPAKRGMRVQYYDFKGNITEGVITGSNGGVLRIRAKELPHSLHYHPTFNLIYYDNSGNILWPKPLTKPETPDTLIDKI